MAISSVSSGLANNINGVDGDPNGSGTGRQVHTLDNPEVTALQERYVRKVIDKLNDLATRPEFVYEHAWAPGDALMWDNASTMHRRDAFDPASRRIMKRTTIMAPEDRAVPF